MALTPFALRVGLQPLRRSPSRSHGKHSTVYRGAVPDACWTVEQQVAEGDTVVTRFTARGTQQGALLGLAPTGRPMVVPGLLISRCRDGKIAVEWAQADLLGLLQQLGVMPHLELDKAVAAAQGWRAGALPGAQPLAPVFPQAPYARGGARTPPIPEAPHTPRT